MKFKVYSGEMALNASVNITCFGSFEADSEKEAIELINTNKKHRYCQKWQFPFESKYVEVIHDNLKWNIFVCEGEEYAPSKVIWKDTNALVSFHTSKKG